MIKNIKDLLLLYILSLAFNVNGSEIYTSGNGMQCVCVCYNLMTVNLYLHYTHWTDQDMGAKIQCESHAVL